MGEDVKFWSLILGQTESPFIVVVLFVLGVGLTLSKKAAEIKGPFGALARWWRDREVRRIEQTQKVWRAHQVAEDEVKDARIADLIEQIKYLKQELSEVRARAEGNSEMLGQINKTVGTVRARLDHPSRLPAPRAELSASGRKMLTY